MIYFYSPFLMCKEKIKELEKINLINLSEKSNREIDNKKDILYLIYDKPHILIKDLIEHCIDVKSIVKFITDGYNEIIDDLNKENTYAISKDRLDAISNDEIIKLSNKNFDINIQLEKKETEYLYSFLTNSILEANSKLLDTYLDIELKALLFNTEADSSYYYFLKDKSQYKDEVIHQIINPCKSKNKEINTLKSYLVKANLKYDNISLEIDNLNSENKKILIKGEEDNKQMSSKIRLIEGNLKEKELENRNLNESNNINNHQLKELNKDLKNFFKTNCDLENLIEKANSNLEIEKKGNEELKIKINRIKNQLESEKQSKEDVVSEMTNIKNELDIEKRDHVESKKDLKKEITNKELLKKELNKNKLALSKNEQIFIKNKNELINHISKLENDINKYKSINNNLNDTNNLLSHQLTELDQDLKLYFTRNINLENLIEKYKIQLNNSIKIIQKLYTKLHNRKGNFIFKRSKLLKLENLLPFNIDNLI